MFLFHENMVGDSNEMVAVSSHHQGLGSRSTHHSFNPFFQMLSLMEESFDVGVASLCMTGA